MSLRSRLLAPCLFLFALAAPTSAQEKSGRVGEELTPKTSSIRWYEERDGRLVPGGTFDTLGAIIVKVAPEHYLVRWRGLQGWVKRDEVLVGAARDAYFAERIRSESSDAHAWRCCAQNMQVVGHFNEALVAIDEAIRLMPFDALAHQVRSVLLVLAKHDVKGALDELSIAERIDPANSDSSLIRAGMWVGQQEYGKAQADLDRAIRLAPTDERVYELRARCWQFQGDSAKAVTDLDTALGIWPDFLLAHVRRARLLSSSDPAVFNPKEAVVSARRACELTHWEDPANLQLLARICDLSGDEDSAQRYRRKVEELRRPDTAKLPPLPSTVPAPVPAPAPAVADSPVPELPAAPDQKDPLVGSELSPKTASVSWYENRDGKAVRGGTFTNPVGTIVGAAPGLFRVHWRGREGWVKRDDVVVGDERAVYFAERARLNPSDAYAQRITAQNLLSGNLFDTAQRYIETAGRLAPDDIVVHQTRAILLALKGDREGARDEFSAAERLDPSDPLTYAERALILWQPLKEYDKAEADFDKALSLAPNDETFYLMRAKYWLARGSHARALTDLNTCIRLWPNNVPAHVERADMLAKCPDRTLLDPKESVVSARRICELTRWEDIAHLRRLVRVCELAGYNDEAGRWREKAEQVERSNAAQLPPLPPAKP
jgi:tetratricopeptide (TPR) repeat protein